MHNYIHQTTSQLLDLRMIPNIEFWGILTISCLGLKTISMFSFECSYGKGSNKADQMAKIGKRHQLFEQLVQIRLILVFERGQIEHRRTREKEVGRS